MTTRPAKTWPARLVRVAAAWALLTGLLVLLGWTFDIAFLKGLLPNWPRMAPLTALVCAIAGLALWSVHAATTNPGQRSTSAFALSLAAFVCPALLIFIGALRLADYVAGWNLRLDLLGFAEPTANAASAARMAPATALNFILLGSAMLLTLRSRLVGATHLLAIVAMLIGWLGLTEILFGGEPLTLFARMAFHTALTFLLLSVGVMGVRAESGLMALLTSDTAGGAVARLLFPALAFPIVMGWLCLQAQRAGWFGVEAGVSVFALSNIVAFGMLVWIGAARLHRSHSERVEAEEASAKDQLLLRAVVDNSPAVICVKDLRGRYLLANRRYEEIFDVPHDAMLGKTADELFPPETAASFRILEQRASGAENALMAEEVAQLADGPHTFLSVTCPLRDAAGATYAVLALSTDITDRKRAERRLQVELGRHDLLNQITRAIGERQDLRSIFQVVLQRLEDNLPIDFGCVCLRESDDALVVTSVGSKSASLALKMDMSERARIPIASNGLARSVQGQVVHEPDVSAVSMPLAQRLAHNGMRSLVIAPLLVESKIFGVLMVARREARSFTSPDCEFLRQLSEHVALAAHQAQIHGALQEAYEDLQNTRDAVLQQERLRSLGQMASGIAHDINNAISPIALYTESLLESEANLSPRTRQYLEIIRRAIGDVATTVTRMREFYRPRPSESGLAAVDLNELVLQVIELTRARWSDMPQQRGIVIEMRNESTPNVPTVMGIEGEIREALTNLVFNAVDAMPDGGVLTLRTEVRTGANATDGNAPRSVCVAVTDIGLGMSEETRRRCLEPFFTTKGERGTGLGLAMVYGMVKRHEAEIELDSTLGAGTTVRLVFPVATVAVADTVKTTILATPSQLRMLIIDDDPLLLESLRHTLQFEGHCVEAANDGAAGIDAFRTALQRNEPFAVVMTDLGMPYVDGRKVAQAVKELSPKTPVILLTGWGKRMQGDGDIPPHVDRMFGKPPKLSELRAALATLTGT
jgi:PAS domain S-box-containing protein